jgi:hypothetical protein
MTEVKIQVTLTQYDDDSTAPFVDWDALQAAHEFREQFEDVIENLLQRTDFNRVSRIAKQFGRLRRESDIDGSFGLHHILEARRMSAELFDELERTGLLAFLACHGSQIRRFVSRDTLPVIDAGLASGHEIDDMVCRGRESDLMKSLFDARRLRTMDADESARIIASLVSGGRTKYKDGEHASRWARRMRLFSATGKLVLGGAFASANLTLGSLAGVVTALPTLTLASLNAAVGIASSTYTGLNLSLDAVKEFAAALEDNQTLDDDGGAA